MHWKVYRVFLDIHQRTDTIGSQSNVCNDSTVKPHTERLPWPKTSPLLETTFAETLTFIFSCKWSPHRGLSGKLLLGMWGSFKERGSTVHSKQTNKKIYITLHNLFWYSCQQFVFIYIALTKLTWPLRENNWNKSSSVQFSPVPWLIGSLRGQWQMIQQGYSSSLFWRRPMSEVLAWASLPNWTKELHNTDQL